MTSKTISCRLSMGEYEAFQRMCQRHKVRPHDMLHSIVIDALLDEGYDALRRQQPEGREGSTEASEGGGATTP